MVKKNRMIPVLLVLILTTLSTGILAAQGFDPVQATNEYLAAIPTEDEARVNAYVNTGYMIMVLVVLAECLLAWVLLRSGWSVRWRDWAEARFNSRFGQAFVYVPIYVVVTTVLLFPLSWYSGFHVEHKFGLSNQSFAGWFAEFLQSGVLGLLGMALFVACLYLLLRGARERWWLWASAMSAVFAILLILISPVFIEPLFNEYRPMDEGPLKERILSIARANGLEADDVQQVDQSRQTTRVSAFVSGLMGTERIALNDNLLNRASPEAVEAVMAHEIGHYVLNHVWKTIAILSLMALLGFGLASAIFHAVLRRHGGRWGLRDIDDYAAFPLLYAIGSVVLFLATPLFYKLIYTQEAEADIFAINAVDNPHAWAEVALLTAEYRKLKPPEWEENWLNHHPSPYARVYMAMRWQAEQEQDSSVGGGE